MSDYNPEFMEEAIRISIDNVKSGGGPFGCVIVKNKKIIARGVNNVTLINDPTAHAEVVAIRNACEKLKDFELKNCQIYTSCEPCPMCLGAIYWARIDKVYYANTTREAARFNFEDQFIYDEILLDPSERNISMIHTHQERAILAFKEWDVKDDRIKY